MMNSKWFSGLLIAAIVAVALVLWFASIERPETQRSQELFLPGLRAQVNDIERIEISAAGSQRVATLVRTQDRWRVAEEHDYEADFEQVVGLLRGLVEARIVESKTAREAWYARLGVEDIAESSATGIRIDFPETGLPAVLVGLAAPGGGGQYVRLADQPQSWLISETLDVPRTALDWLERSVMDIPRSEIESVTIRSADGEIVKIQQVETDTGDGQFVLLEVPEGREAQAAWQLARVADGLANVHLEGVRPASDTPEDAVRALYVTRDGMEFVASLFTDEAGDHWVHFRVSADTPPLGEGEHLTSEDNERLVDAVAVDARLSPWFFRIAAAKFETMTRRMEDLLVAVEDESAPDGQ